MKTGANASTTFGSHVGVCIAALWVLFALPHLALSQVMEIDSAGVVTLHKGPEVTSAEGARAIIESDIRRDTLPTNGAATREDIDVAAAEAQLSPALVEAVAWRESRMSAQAISPAGAIGEMQLMPATARELGVDPRDPRQNIKGGAIYLADLLKHYDGDLVRALAAYNAGPRAVDRFGGIPPYSETQNYVAAILDRLSRRAAAAPER